MAVSGAGFRMEVEDGDSLNIDAPQELEERIEKITKDLSRIYDITPDVEIRVLQHIESHVGLGSTTQLTLGLGRALTTLFEKDISSVEIAREVGRGRFSGVGTYAFERGGFIGEGGVSGEEFPPLIFRHEFPERWRFVVAIPDVERGPEEEGEEEYFEGLEPEGRISENVCFSLVMKMLPALLNENIEKFGEALTEIDELVGRAFSPKQGGVFRGDAVSGVRDYLKEAGAYGVGQSSWGPAVYGLAEGSDQATELEAKVRGYLEERGLLDEVMVVNPDNTGAEVKVR